MSSTNDIDQERKLHQQEALERREKIQEVVSGVQEGKLPTTADITQSIDQVKQSGTFQETASSMSPAGQKVMADTERMLDTAKKVLEEKNSNDELQTAIFHGAKAAKGTATTAKHDASRRDIKGHLEAGGNSAQELLQEGSRRAWNVARVVVTSSEFRRLVNDLQQVLQDAIESGISGNEERKANVGSNIGDDRESSPREAVHAIGDTGRQQVGSAYKGVTAGAEPIIMGFSAGELSTKDAGKELGRAAARGIRSTVDGIELTDEQRDVLVGRFKKILLEAHASDEFQSALDDLLEIVQALSHRGEELGQKAASTAKTAKSAHDEDIAIAHNSAKQLVEKFASGKSLDPLMNAITNMGRDMRNDPELRKVMDEMNEFLRRSLRDTDYIERADWNQEASNLLKRGRYVLQERYRGHTDAIFDEARAFTNALQRDTVTNEFTRDLEQLTRDLFLDDNGNPTIKFDLVKDFAKIVPIIAAKLDYLALPKIESSDDEYDYILDNIVLRCSNIIPRHLRIHTDTRVNIQTPGSRDRVQEEVSVEDAGVQLHNRIQVTISQIRAHATDMAFYYNKKTGLAKMMDVGYADLTIPDKGLEIHLTLVQAEDSDRANAIKVEKAEATIHDFKLKLHDTKHDFLYKILSPFINKAVKRQAEKAISQKMAAIVFQIDQQLGKLSDQASQVRQKAANKTTDVAANAADKFQESTGVNVPTEKLGRDRSEGVAREE